MTKTRPSFKAILFLLPLLFAQAAYGDINSDLLEAAWAGDTAEVEQLLEQGADVSSKDKFRRTALMYAARYGHTDTAKALIGAGADMNARNKFSGTALGLAKGNVEIISLLLLSKEMTLEKNPAP